MAMNKLRSLLLGKEGNQGAKNVIWNIVGSMVFTLATMILMSAAGRAAGSEGGAAFTAAFTLAQQLLTIGYFEVRTFQVSDLKEEYSFGDYFTFRMITCGMMAAAGMVYLFAAKPEMAAGMVILLMVFYKMADGLSDVFEAEFQKKDRLDLAGKTMGLRTIVSVGIFLVVVFATKNVLTASFAAVVGAFAAFVFFDVILLKDFSDIRFRTGHLVKLFKDCFLLFIGSFFSLYVLNAAKYAADIYLTADEYYAFTAAIFMPASCINLVAGFLFKPVLVSLVESYQDRKYHQFVGLNFKLLAGVGGVTVLGMIGAYLLGVPVLELVYPVELDTYKAEMLLVILGGGFNAASIMLYYTLTVMRKQKLICGGYLVTAILGVAVPYVMTRNLGMLGAAISFCILMLIQTAVFGTLLFVEYKKYKKQDPMV